VLDADALNHFAGRLDALAALLGGRPALLTPHPLEFARLVGRSVDAVLAARFAMAGELAARLDAAVLLKGVPTVVAGPDGRTHVVAAGTPALATGGSGDLLGGLAGALLAGAEQRPTPADAGAAAAWVHGRAAELATEAQGGVRGTTLDDVLAALPDAWPRARADAGAPLTPVLAELPAVPA
jgi:NAD(P)H-hydrate epimerase